MTKKLVLGGALAAVVVVAALGGAFWYYFLRDDAPAEVSLGGALESLGTTTPAASSTQPNTQPTAATATTGLAGNWSIAAGTETFVGYRVKEELAQVGFTTAVGRTPSVTGTFTVEGSTTTAGTITAQLSGLQSDRSQRDQALRQQALETGRFPTATFELTKPVTIPEGALKGEQFSATLQGKLTLHGVTRDVAIAVQAQLKDNFLVVVGSLEIVFADYNIAQPRANAVLSVENQGTMELQLFFKKS